MLKIKLPINTSLNNDIAVHFFWKVENDFGPHAKNRPHSIYWDDLRLHYPRPEGERDSWYDQWEALTETGELWLLANMPDTVYDIEP